VDREKAEWLVAVRSPVSVFGAWVSMAATISTVAGALRPAAMPMLRRIPSRSCGGLELYPSHRNDAPRFWGGR